MVVCWMSNKMLSFESSLRAMFRKQDSWICYFPPIRFGWRGVGGRDSQVSSHKRVAETGYFKENIFCPLVLSFLEIKHRWTQEFLKAELYKLILKLLAQLIWPLCQYLWFLTIGIRSKTALLCRSLVGGTSIKKIKCLHVLVEQAKSQLQGNWWTAMDSS